MRVVALLFGLLGAAGSGFLGAKWLSDFDKEKPKLELVQKLAAAGEPESQAAVVKLEKLKNTAYSLLACSALAVVACVVVMTRQGAVAAALFFIALVVPIALMGDGKIAIFTFGLAMAGLFSFFVKPKVVQIKPKSEGIPAGTDMV